MKDIDIRGALRDSVLKAHIEDPTTIVVDEFGILQGDVRIDIAVLNGQINGYEIKSERDTLERLPHQAELYSKVFDNVTLVVSGKHCNKATQIIPEWWGILEAQEGSSNDNIYFNELRRPQDNPVVDVRSVVELLWKDEAIELLAARGAAKGYRSRPRWHIWDRLCEVYEQDELINYVRCRVKQRITAQRLDSNGD